MADANLWGVLVGGLIGIAGGVIGPTMLHLMQTKERDHRLRADKFQEIASTVLETQVWLDNVRDDKLWGKEVRPGVSPITKVYAIATIYFPELSGELNDLQEAVQEHATWIAGAALKKVGGHTNFVEDFGVSYGPFIEQSERDAWKNQSNSSSGIQNQKCRVVKIG
jgi:hypothetical protein